MSNDEPAPDGLTILQNRLIACKTAHEAKGSEYERGGNTRGSMQARAVANLLGALLDGDNWRTVVP